jgi:hypothetical protein
MATHNAIDKTSMGRLAETKDGAMRRRESGVWLWYATRFQSKYGPLIANVQNAVRLGSGYCFSETTCLVFRAS